MGDMAIVHLEARTWRLALKAMGESDAPHDRWFAEHCADVHGLGLREPLPPRVGRAVEEANRRLAERGTEPLPDGLTPHSLPDLRVACSRCARTPRR